MGATKRRGGWLPDARRHPRILWTPTQCVKPQKSRFSGPPCASTGSSVPLGLLERVAKDLRRLRPGHRETPIEDEERNAADAHRFHAFVRRSDLDATGRRLKMCARGIRVESRLGRQQDQRIDAADVDRVVLGQFLEQLQEHRDEASRAMLQLMGQNDLFAKAAVDATIRNANVEEVRRQGLPPQARQWLGMLGFKVVIDYHGEVVRIDMPAGPASEEDE